MGTVCQKKRSIQTNQITLNYTELTSSLAKIKIKKSRKARKERNTPIVHVITRVLGHEVLNDLWCVCVQVVSSAIVDKYIGESARLIREMFAFARDHEPCIIFMDEIDAIGQ